MRIKVTEKTIKLSIEEEPGIFKLKVFSKDDEVTVEDKIGRTCVEQGWADDVDGNIETGPRIPGVKVIQPNNVKSETS